MIDFIFFYKSFDSLSRYMPHARAHTHTHTHTHAHTQTETHTDISKVNRLKIPGLKAF